MCYGNTIWIPQECVVFIHVPSSHQEELGIQVTCFCEWMSLFELTLRLLGQNKDEEAYLMTGLEKVEGRIQQLRDEELGLQEPKIFSSSSHLTDWSREMVLTLGSVINPFLSLQISLSGGKEHGRSKVTHGEWYFVGNRTSKNSISETKYGTESYEQELIIRCRSNELLSRINF